MNSPAYNESEMKNFPPSTHDRPMYGDQHSNTAFPPHATPNNNYNHPPQAQQPGYPQQPYYPPQQQPQYFSSPQQQQQQSSVTMINAGQPQMVVAGQGMRNQSFCGHITLACFVFWCCGCLFGLIAFILAMIAKDKAGVGNGAEARKLGRASLGVSIAGIVVTCIIVAIAVGLCVTSRGYCSINYNSGTYYQTSSCTGYSYYCYSAAYGGYGCYCYTYSG